MMISLYDRPANEHANHLMVSGSRWVTSASNLGVPNKDGGWMKKKGMYARGFYPFGRHECCRDDVCVWTPKSSSKFKLNFNQLFFHLNQAQNSQL